jgi:DNA polymerase-4
MHQFLFVRLVGFFARALLKQDQELIERPIVIHRDKRVLDVDERAESRQVYRGMALSEAKAILPEAAFVAWQEEPYREAQAAWLDLCTEVSDVVEPFEQNSAWIDLSLQPDAEALALRLVERIHETFGLRAMAGLGTSKWIARLAAENHPTPQRLNASMPCILAMHESLSNPAAFLAPMKTRSLLPVDPAHRARLEFLGYSTIGEVAKVPLNVLRGQFGEAATHIRMCARGGYFEPVEAKYPPNSLSERIGFEGVVEDLQVLDEGLKRLAFAISEKLTKEDRQAKDVVVTLEHEEFLTTVLRRKFTKPIQNYASALASLRLLLTPSPVAPLIGVRIRLENVTQSKRVQQELTGRNADREKGAAAAFQHIRTVFGDGAIQTGRDVVEPRRKQVLRAWKDATGWL